MFRRLAMLSALGAALGARSVAAADNSNAAAGASVVLAAPPADADARTLRDACVDAHALAQEARQNQDLRAARELLRTCSQAACPQVVRADCGPWYDEVERSLPSLVFAASSPRGDETAVRVLMDGALLADGLSSAAVDVNPGQHQFRFELAGYPALEQALLVREGEKSRVVYVKFEPSASPSVAPPSAAPSAQANAPPPAVPAKRAARPIPTGSYVAAGGALLGVVWGGYFGGRALSARSRAENTCKPICDEDTVHDVRDKALLADVGFAVAALSASAAVYFYLTRPTVGASSSVALGVGGDARGSRLSLSGAF